MDKSPDAFRTISEVAEDLDLPQHVLRFWETRFPQIKPLKRGGGRRYYRPDDVDLLRGIRQLLYGQGYTIKGVQRILKQDGLRFVQSIGRGERTIASPPPGADEADEGALFEARIIRSDHAGAPGRQRARLAGASAGDAAECPPVRQLRAALRRIVAGRHSASAGGARRTRRMRTRSRCVENFRRFAVRETDLIA